MKTLFILHGWQSSKEKWEKVKEELEENKIEVIIPDIPGFKEDLERVWNLDDYVNWFFNFSQKKEKFFLLGHSFGGRIAIKFATKFPKKLEGLILISSAGIKRKEPFFLKFFRKFKAFSFLPGFSLFRKFFYKFILRKTDYLKTKGNLRETFKNIISEDLTPFLDKIKVKTLILWGEKDKITPLSDAYLMKEKIKNSKLEILKNISHIPHLENPVLLSEKILNFIKSV